MNCDEDCAAYFHSLDVLIRFELISTPGEDWVIKRGVESIQRRRASVGDVVRCHSRHQREGVTPCSWFPFHEVFT